MEMLIGYVWGGRVARHINAEFAHVRTLELSVEYEALIYILLTEIFHFMWSVLLWYLIIEIIIGKATKLAVSLLENIENS